MKIFVLVKRNILTIVFGLFLVFLVIFSKNNLVATKDGLVLWATCVVPSLFPFFIATELLNYTNIAKIFGKLLSKIMRPLFNIPGEGAYAFIMGVISGYPVGAKIVSDFYERGICTKDEAERMIAFTNNSGPLFIIGTVGILLFGSSTIGILLFITHLLSAISVGLIFGISSKVASYTSKKYTSRYKSVSNTNKNFTSKNNLRVSNTNTSSINNSPLSDLGEILSSSISKSISNILQIGGFVILFSVILSILNRLNIISWLSIVLTNFNIPYDFSNGLISGIIELTNGINVVCKIQTKAISSTITLCAFLLGFGGFSILLQVLSIISKYGLSVKNYFCGKILQGILAAFYTLFTIRHCSIFNLDIPINAITSNVSSYEIWLTLVLSIIITIIIFSNQKKKCYS